MDACHNVDYFHQSKDNIHYTKEYFQMHFIIVASVRLCVTWLTLPMLSVWFMTYTLIFLRGETFRLYYSSYWELLQASDYYGLTFYVVVLNKFWPWHDHHLSSTGVKDFSNWPTIPQVYFNGEFVGGCDILLQMHQNGDLVEELKKLGITSALLDAEKDSK